MPVLPDPLDGGHCVHNETVQRMTKSWMDHLQNDMLTYSESWYYSHAVFPGRDTLTWGCGRLLTNRHLRPSRHKIDMAKNTCQELSCGTNIWKVN